MNDPYVQSNGTLKNKLNISDREELEEKERNVTVVRLYEIQKNKSKIKKHITQSI